MIDETGEFFFGSYGKLNLIISKDSSLGDFDINVPDRFEHIVEKIDEISMDHIVLMKSKNLR